MPGEWSQAEVEAIVADYFTMLSLELRREPYNKAAHRRDLIQLLNGRSQGAVERKHQNISYLEREARNASLGRAGEEFVLNVVHHFKGA
ncbi:hypothetical protein QM565_10800 [Geitlerinema splendidum]|nr:hypothetical protein [Geitlerinema splendidum]